MGGLLRELRAWGSALKQLPENPLHEMLRRIETNRRRTDSAVILFAVFTGLAWLLLLVPPAAVSSEFLEDGRMDYVGLLRQYGYILGNLLLPPAAISLLWLAYALFNTLRASLLCLSDSTELALPGRVEQEHLLTGLADRELLLPMLSSNFRRLLAPVLLLNFSAALLRHHGLCYVRAGRHHDNEILGLSSWHPGAADQLPAYFQWDNLLLVLYWFAAGSLLGLLACLILLFIALILGSTLRSSVQINAAAALGSLLVPGAVLFSAYLANKSLVVNNLSASPEAQIFLTYLPDYLGLLGATGCLGMVSFACILLLRASLRWSWLRQALSLGLPLLAIIGAGVPAVLFLFGHGLELKLRFLVAGVGLQCQAALGIFLPCCISWLPGILPLVYAGNDTVGGLTFPMYEWWRFPLALTFQLLLLTNLARLALKALRSGEE